jgi:micrococcal nuclease
MNTPEMDNFGKTRQCFALEAKNKLTEMVGGKTVELEKDVSETDKYGRLLRYVWLNGEMINEKLVALGYARVATYPPDVKYKDRFIAAERLAREKNLGLWGECGVK